MFKLFLVVCLFVQNNFLKILSDNINVLVRPSILSGLTWVHTVCKNYQKAIFKFQIGSPKQWLAILHTDFNSFLSIYLNLVPFWQLEIWPALTKARSENNYVGPLIYSKSNLHWINRSIEILQIGQSPNHISRVLTGILIIGVKLLSFGKVWSLK